MGFPTLRCKKALLANPADPDAAVQWLFDHMEDPDIDAPLPSSGAGAPAGAAAQDPDKINLLQSMGFGAGQASKALRETVSDT
jgi:ubiquitin carboxyl-terminal hydrolase 5/13